MTLLYYMLAGIDVYFCLFRMGSNVELAPTS